MEERRRKADRSGKSGQRGRGQLWAPEDHAGGACRGRYISAGSLVRRSLRTDLGELTLQHGGHWGPDRCSGGVVGQEFTREGRSRWANRVERKLPVQVSVLKGRIEQRGRRPGGGLVMGPPV